MHSSRHLVFVLAVFLVLAAAGALFYTSGSRPAPSRRLSASETGGARTDGAAGIDPDDVPEGPPARGTVVSPSGRRITFGQTDELGYVLPLDVRRPRPQRPKGTAQDRDEILRLREAAGRTTFEEYRLSPDDGHTQNETAISAQGDTVLAAFHRFTDTSLMLGVSRSSDGGHSWTGTAISDFHTALTDPCVKSAGSGRWMLSYLAMGGVGGSDYDVFTRTSTDGGLTWGNPVNVTNDSNFDDKPYVAARGTDVVVGYADFAFSPAKLRVVRSINGGASYDHDTILAVNSGGGNGACPVIDPSGTWHVFWRDSYQDSLWVSHSTDRGLTWSADRGIVDMFPLPSQLPPGFRMINLPSAAADPLTGVIVVVWNDQRFGNPDILSIRSTDGGHSWSAPIRVNDDVGTTAQFFPWITFDPYGVVHVCWYDRREDGSKIDVYYARSLDDGASYQPNIRVTAQAYTPVLPWDVSTAFIGDYNAITANGAYAYPCYQDAREGNQDVYVSLLPAGGPGLVADGQPARSAISPLSVVPSVLREQVILRSKEHPGALVDVYTAGARRVREIRLSGSGSASWDGRDAAGAAVPSGVYFARLRSGGEAARIVKVR